MINEIISSSSSQNSEKVFMFDSVEGSFAFYVDGISMILGTIIFWYFAVLALYFTSQSIENFKF